MLLCDTMGLENSNVDLIGKQIDDILDGRVEDGEKVRMLYSIYCFYLFFVYFMMIQGFRVVH